MSVVNCSIFAHESRHSSQMPCQELMCGTIEGGMQLHCCTPWAQPVPSLSGLSGSRNLMFVRLVLLRHQKEGFLWPQGNEL